MHEILKDDILHHQIYKPFPTSSNKQLWEDFPIHRDKDAFTGNQWNKTSGAGLPPLPVKQLLDINMMSQYIMHHGCLGSSNATYGIAMNVALQADWHTIFGYLLGYALGPWTVTAQSDFMHIYGCVVVLPSYYHKAINIWNISNPTIPFVENSGDNLTIHPYDNKLAPEAILDTVTQHLICHGIPLQWIDHAYMFSLYHLNHQSHLQARLFQDLYCKMDCEWLQ